jgi:3,4-dihydroxy 2-butanone 4-phosphate synthase/GTP cyclohydrolase II
VHTPISQILDDLRAGRFVVVTDDESRENEGDLVIAAQHVSPEAVNFMVRKAGGYMFLSLTSADCDRLDLHGQTARNTSVRGTPLTVSIDGHPRHGFTTGVSATERANTIRLAIDPRSGPDDFVRPGHINPLRARDGGVLVRTGHTEAIVDLCRLAGLYPAAVGIEVCRPDGEMARAADLETFCAEHDIRMCSIASLIEYRLARESLVRRLEPRGGTPISTPEGEFTLIAYESVVDPLPHVALTVGGVGVPDDAGVVAPISEPTLVRVHRRSLLGDVFGEPGPGGTSSGAMLRASMRAIQEAGRGAVVYLRPEGVGDDLSQRLLSIRRPGAISDAPDLTPATDASRAWREVGIGSQILRDLGLTKLRLLTNSRTEHPGLEGYGLSIEARVAVDA